jgi:glycosyltransferase involved in cell wall biosynthesis
MIVGIDASNIGSGGTIRHLVEILSRVDPSAYAIERVIVWGSRRLLEDIAPRPWLWKVPEQMLESRLLPVRLLWRVAKFPWLVRDRCDVLFVPSGTYGGAFRPFVTISQNVLPFEFAEVWRYRFSHRLVKFLGLRMYQTATFRRAAGVIFLTEQARQRVEQCIGTLPGKVAIVPHGIAETFRLHPRPQHTLSAYSWQQPFRWLYTSTVDLYKHQWSVVEAIVQLRQQGIPVTLDLVGGTVYKPALDRLRQVLRQIDPDGKAVCYHGAVSGDRLAAFYREADGFVFMSSCEAFGQTLLEAMAAGLPVVCSNRSVMPSLLGNAGVYCDPESPAEIAHAMEGFLEDAMQREQCAWAGYEQAQLYSWERCARETFRFISSVTLHCPFLQYTRQ